LFRKVATELRKELQTIAPHFNLHWGNSNTISKHLGGYCGFGSTMVWQKLTKMGFKPKIASGVGHWFTVCDNILVDITASQFSQPMVCVRDYEDVQRIIVSNERAMNFWKATKLSSNPNAAGLNTNLEQIKNGRMLTKEAQKNE